MKRLGIIVLFDVNGKIDFYLKYLVSSIQNLFHKIVFVINGFIQEEDYHELINFTQFIFIRENKGFDAEAYKDAFCKYIPQQEWIDYDEILLMNDTFYGPFYPLSDIWNMLDQVKADFWGITRHPQGRYADGREMPAHIQGYFLVIRKKLLQSRAFLTFWEEMPTLDSVQDAINGFEIRFTVFFEGCGFRGKALMDLGRGSSRVEYNKNPYLNYNLWLIRDKRVPFLKKKSLCFQLPGYKETLDAIEYIERETLYDTSMIWKNILRLSKENQFQSTFNYSKLEDFYYNHSRIFIYGAGKYGQKVKKYFVCRNWFYTCFLVSREKDVGDECVKYDPAMILPSDGIIMALNQKNLEEVLSQIIEKVPEEQLFLPEGLF